MFRTYDHEAILCREVVNVNPYITKKGSTQRSKSALHSAGSLFARETHTSSEEKEDYSACMFRKAEETLLRLRDTNKAFLGLSQMMPWLFLRKKCLRITMIKSVLQPRRLALRRRSCNFTFPAQTTAF